MSWRLVARRLHLACFRTALVGEPETDKPAALVHGSARTCASPMPSGQDRAVRGGMGKSGRYPRGARTRANGFLGPSSWRSWKAGASAPKSAISLNRDCRYNCFVHECRSSIRLRQANVSLQ